MATGHEIAPAGRVVPQVLKPDENRLRRPSTGTCWFHRGDKKTKKALVLGSFYVGLLFPERWVMCQECKSRSAACEMAQIARIRLPDPNSCAKKYLRR